MTDPPGPEFIDGARNAPVASVVYVATLDPVRLRRHSFWYSFIGTLGVMAGGAALLSIPKLGWSAAVLGLIFVLAGLILLFRGARFHRLSHGN